MEFSNESETQYFDFNITGVDLINTSVELINDNNKDIQGNIELNSNKVEVADVEV